VGHVAHLEEMINAVKITFHFRQHYFTPEDSLHISTIKFYSWNIKEKKEVITGISVHYFLYVVALPPEKYSITSLGM